MPLSQEQIDEVFASFNDGPSLGNKTNGNGHSLYGLSAWNAGEDTSPPKTAVRYAQAIALATGRNLTDEHVFQRAHVLIVSLEDDASEMRRRVLAARMHFNIPASEVDGWLFLASPGAAGGKLMTTDKNGRAVHGQLSANLEAEIIAHSIDLVLLDPFVKSHGVEENLNSAIDDVAQILSDLAAKYDIAVDVPHHISKGVGDPGNANRGRGATSLVNACRLVSTLTPMSSEEAEAFDVSRGGPPPLRSHRPRQGQHHQGRRRRQVVPPGRRSVGQRNRRLSRRRRGPDRRAMEAAGNLGRPRQPAAQPDSVCIDAGMGDGDFYTDGNRTIERSAWQVVHRHAPAKSEVQCREVIRTWISNGVLVPFDYDSPSTRKRVKGLG